MPTRRSTLRMLRLALTLGSWAVLGVVVYLFGGGGSVIDAWVYHTADLDHLYAGSSVATATYNYSPAFAWWTTPLRALPWPVFHTLVIGLEVVSLAYLVSAPLAAVLILAQAPLVFLELDVGNLNLLTAAFVVAAVRAPALWAFPLLTKVTPGVGLVWYAVRLEWRALGVALIATLLFALPAVILMPGAWGEWLTVLSGNVGASEELLRTIPVLLRLGLAAVVVAWGAATGRLWAVPLGAAVAVTSQAVGWLIVLGIVRLYRDGRMRTTPARWLRRPDAPPLPAPAQDPHEM